MEPTGYFIQYLIFSIMSHVIVCSLRTETCGHQAILICIDMVLDEPCSSVTHYCSVGVSTQDSQTLLFSRCQHTGESDTTVQ